MRKRNYVIFCICLGQWRKNRRKWPQVHRPALQNPHNTSISFLSSRSVCSQVSSTEDRFPLFAVTDLFHTRKHLLTHIYLQIFLDCNQHNFVTTKSFRPITYFNFISDGVKFTLSPIKNHSINIYGYVEVQLHAFQTSALDEDERSGSRSSHCSGERVLGTELCGPQRRV
jgi:hypothetical protein